MGHQQSSTANLDCGEGFLQMMPLTRIDHDVCHCCDCITHKVVDRQYDIVVLSLEVGMGHSGCRPSGSTIIKAPGIHNSSCEVCAVQRGVGGAEDQLYTAREATITVVIREDNGRHGNGI